LSHLTRKIVPKVTYNVSSGTPNITVTNPAARTSTAYEQKRIRDDERVIELSL